jgi:hypothetical protein
MLLDDTARRRAMGAAAAARARTLFTPERFAAGSEAAYAEALRWRRASSDRATGASAAM